MTNAFTTKPDLSKFWKQVNKSQQVSVNGKRASNNPTAEQKAAFYNLITSKGKK
jgi:hypothetical protein